MSEAKKILILPGTRWQLAIVKKIKELGYFVLLTDPSENAPCIKYADKFLKSDIFDVKRICEFIDENPIDAVLSDQCDIAMPIVAWIAQKYNLTALSMEMARLYTDKYCMREFCKNNHIKYPEYRLCKTEDDAAVFLDEIECPIIIKPIDCNASKGVFQIHQKEEIKKCFKEALFFSRRQKLVLAERYINGTEFTIDGIKTAQKHYTLAISEKKHFDHNVNIADELRFSHYSDQFDYELLRRTNDNFIMRSDLEFGFTHAEYKYENGDFYLIEIAARGGGNEISSIITQYLSGYDTYDYLINCSLGNVQDVDFSIKNEYRERAAVLKFFHTPNGGGKVSDIRGLDYLDREPDIVEYVLNFKIGDIIEDCVSDSARIGFYIACSENMDKLEEVIKNVDEIFKIELLVKE